jgi:hypothetical protein
MHSDFKTVNITSTPSHSIPFASHHSAQVFTPNNLFDPLSISCIHITCSQEDVTLRLEHCWWLSERRNINKLFTFSSVLFVGAYTWIIMIFPQPGLRSFPYYLRWYSFAFKERGRTRQVKSPALIHRIFKFSNAPKIDSVVKNE